MDIPPDIPRAAYLHALLEVLCEMFPPPPTREEVAAQKRRSIKREAAKIARSYNDGRPCFEMVIRQPLELDWATYSDSAACEPSRYMRLAFPLRPEIRYDPKRAQRIWRENVEAAVEFEMQQDPQWRGSNH